MPKMDGWVASDALPDSLPAPKKDGPHYKTYRCVYRIEGVTEGRGVKRKLRKEKSRKAKNNEKCDWDS